MAPEDLLLPVQRQMVDAFGHDHLRQKTRAGRTLFDWLHRLASRTHSAGTGIFQAGILDHQYRSRNVFVALAGFLADQAQILEASGTVLFFIGQIVNDTLPLEVLWQRLPATAPFLGVAVAPAGLSGIIVVIGIVG